MVSMLFRDPQAQSSTLAALGTLQPWSFGSLNRVETLDSVSNYYIVAPTLTPERMDVEVEVGMSLTLMVDITNHNFIHRFLLPYEKIASSYGSHIYLFSLFS